MGQVARVAALTAVAVVVAICSAFLHLAIVRPAGVPVPYGLVLALLGVAALLTIAYLTARTRVGTGVVAAGWLVPVVLLSQPTSAGDLVIAGDARGLTYLFGGIVLVGVAVGVPARRRADDQTGGGLG